MKKNWPDQCTFYNDKQRRNKCECPPFFKFEKHGYFYYPCKKHLTRLIKGFLRLEDGLGKLNYSTDHFSTFMSVSYRKEHNEIKGGGK